MTAPLAPPVGSAPTIRRVADVSRRKGIVMMIDSDSGVGKTSLLSTLPPDRTVVIDVDEGTLPLAAPGYPLLEDGSMRPAWNGHVVTLERNAGNLKQINDWLCTSNHGYTTAVLDNVSVLEKLLVFRSASEQKVTIQDYGDAAVTLRGTLYRWKELAEKGINVIFLAHVRTDLKGAEGEKFPSLSDKLCREIFGIVDLAGYLSILPDGKTRCLQFAPTNTIHAKSRIPAIRDYECLDLRDILGRALGSVRAVAPVTPPVAAPVEAKPVTVETPKTAAAKVEAKPEVKKEK